jgi:NAD(P)H-quinone oxidoreductase subunit 5
MSFTNTQAASAGQWFAAFCLAAALAAAPFLDHLSAILLALSGFLFFTVCRYSARYMAGDPGQARFTFWLCLTGALVFALVLARNLLWFSFAWCGISLSLHQLLQFYRHRPGALLAARKKFFISRLGDLALFTAVVLTYSAFGSLDFQVIFAAAREPQPAVAWIAPLLAFAALLKSAQFPFHSWLPDTMETPTPVSALMHAGIINAGGILVIRLSPLIVQSDTAMAMLALTGAFTALFASVVMLTQASVKRCLAFSTVAQMGFMMLECGLGAFHLALLHLVAHSLYKAHAFLSTGAAVQAPLPPRPRAAGVLTFIASLAAASLIVALTGYALGVSPLAQPILTGIFTLAIAQLLCFASTATGLALALAASVAYFLLDRAAEHLIDAPRYTAHWLAAPILAAFLLITLFQLQLPRLVHTRFFQALYVHARNGFYCNSLANRFTTALWPVKTSEGNY